MSQPVVIPLGRTAREWVRQGGQPSRTAWVHGLMLRWQGYWFDRNVSLQRQLPEPPPLRTDPLFILGLWRSGTTYLHDLLGVCPGLQSPATWQCMNPSTSRLCSSPVVGRAIQRPMDTMTIDAFSPQEDEFALLALGVPSVYRGFFDPRRLPELSRWLEPDAWTQMQPEGWLNTWLEFLSGITNDRSGRLVLKSPSHSFRITALTEAFPQASYVWLVRDPVATFHSNRKMWLAMLERYALWHWDVSILDAFLVHAFESAAQCLYRATRLVGKDRLIIVKFDDLTGATINSLQRLNLRLGIGSWQELEPPLVRIAAGRSGYRPDTSYRGQLRPAVLQATNVLRAAQLDALSSHGL